MEASMLIGSSNNSESASVALLVTYIYGSVDDIAHIILVAQRLDGDPTRADKPPILDLDINDVATAAKIQDQKLAGMERGTAI
jgi:hypothetical protein